MTETTEKTAVDLVAIDELLASIDEDKGPMDVCEADGYMTAILLLKKMPKAHEWISTVFSTEGKESTTGDAAADRQLVALLKARMSEIEAALKNSELLDPAYFELEDDHGKPLGGPLAIAALEPFAMGFLEACQQWPELLETSNPKIAAALIGIFRHLPKDALGEFAATKRDLDRDVPLANLPEALSDLASCVAEIAFEVHGYAIPELDETNTEE